MSESLAAPILDPSELSPEEMDAIHEAERIIDESLDRYLAVADTPNARKDITESIERQAFNDPVVFLAAREKLSNSTNEEDPTDDQIEKEEVLKDVLDGPVRARTVTKYGVFAAPTPEVRARVEHAIAAVRDAESTEGKMANRISAMNASSANQLAYGESMSRLRHARETGNTADMEIYGEAVRNLRRSMDIQSRGTGNTQREVDEIDNWIAEMRHDDPDITDDDPRIQSAMRERTIAYGDLEKVRSVIGELPSQSARERLRSLLDEHPEGIDVIHRLENAHIGFSTGEKVDKHYNDAQEKLAKATDKVTQLQHELPAGDGRIALAQIAEFKARAAFNTIDAHHSKDRETAEFLGNLADENAIDKRVREEQEKAMGNLGELENAAAEALLEWQHKQKAVAEYGAFVGIKKVEAYISALDEKIALAERTDRRLPHYRALRDEAFDSYLQIQYQKELVRTEMLANNGDFEGRHPLGHTPDKGIMLERSNGTFIIYPDGTYCSVYTDEAGMPQRTPRVNAQGEAITTPVLEPIDNPRDLLESTTIRAWESMTLDNLKDVNAAVYGAWVRDPSNTMARAQLEVVSGILREHSAFEDNTLTHMEATYTERYMAVGREGNADSLTIDGSVAGHMTLHGIEGGWVLHPNGAADLYTPGVTEPTSRYAPDGTIIGEAPEPPETPDSPEAPDDGEGGDGGSPDDDPGAPDDDATRLHPVITPTPMPAPAPRPAAPTPSSPVRPRTPAPGTPGAIGSVRRPRSLLATVTPETTLGHSEASTTDAEMATLVAAEKAARGRVAISSRFQTTPEDSLNDVSNISADERQVWSPDEVTRYNIAPESVLMTPVADGVHFHYSFEPRKADNPHERLDGLFNHLTVDTVLPADVAKDLMNSSIDNPQLMREFVRKMFSTTFDDGAEIWESQARPPYYEMGEDAKITLAIATAKGDLIVNNYPIGA